MLNELAQLFDRDIQRVIDQLNLFKDEQTLWVTSGAISNSSGNLAIHLVGNLNHFIGSQLGQTGYIRNRPSEFGDQNITRHKITDELTQTKAMVSKTLSILKQTDLDQPFPIEVFGGMTTGTFLIHLYGHLNYHLGQINYLRRVLKG